MNQDTFTHAWEQAERQRCADSFPYFCETYIKVRHLLRGIIPFKLHPYQVKYAVLLGNNRFVITKKFRQGGFSTLNVVWSIWNTLLHDPGLYMHVTKTDREAIMLSEQCRLVLQFLPEWLAPKLTRSNDHQVEFGDSKLFFYTFEASRGRSIRHLFIDEAAYFKDMQRTWDCLFPCVATGGRMSITSTLNKNDRKDPDWFLKTLLEAREGRNSFIPYEPSHMEHPEYSNEEWVKNSRENLGRRSFAIEVLGEIIDGDDKPHHKPDMNLTPRMSSFRIIHRAANEPFRDSVKPDEQGHKEIMDSIAEVVDLRSPEIRSSGLQEDVSVAFDLLKLAGVVPNEAEVDDPCCYDDFKDDLLNRIKQGMSKDLKLGLVGNRLTVNGLDTRIKTKVVEMAFVGLAELAGYEKAMDSVSRLVRRKLKVLF